MSCFTCKVFGEENTDCQGVLQQCENDDDFCATQIESSRIGNDNRVIVRKRCMPAANKNVCRPEPMKLDCTKLILSLYSECCFEDGCNSNGLKIPADNTTKNGHQCPTCFVENSNTCPCSKTELKECTGNANTCLEFSGHVQRPEDVEKLYAFKGCVDGNLCKTDLSKLPGCEVGSDAKLTCT
ncbi:phospholipase A2 inhibitor and Ly6/PLAUR domain-containing protein-like [Rana temporaria]|uniref:phospholipase A2 inhibitor and Ly6/PLAUR domain-containing protein-like n=1 Tax=Rana temporaria TaxID=8407 RepID=UPI001AAC5972|nr:phospholipase A2 inhibitor and Ly6/PLAUR domain-containing protein-like [Rana temporaria]